jgi:hypothetical protein
VARVFNPWWLGFATQDPEKWLGRHGQEYSGRPARDRSISISGNPRRAGTKRGVLLPGPLIHRSARSTDHQELPERTPYTVAVPPQRNQLTVLLGFFAVLSIAVLAIVASYGSFAVFLKVLAGLLFLAPCLAISLFLTIAVHELGHYWAGRAVGFRFEAIQIGPLHWKRDEVKIRFKPDWTRFSGKTDMSWPEQMQSWTRYGIFVAGGPIASLVSAIVSALSVAAGENVWGEFTIWSLRFFAVSNGTGFLMSLMGSGIPGRNNDGDLLRMAWSGTRRAAQSAWQLANTWGEQRLRPRDWEVDKVAKILGRNTDPSLRFWLYRMHFNQALDRGHWAAAQVAMKELLIHLEFASSEWPGELEYDDARLDAAYFTAGYLKDAAKARRLIDRVKEVGTDGMPTARRALIALDFAEGRVERARIRVERAKRKLDPSKWLQDVESDWLDNLVAWQSINSR